MSIGVSTEEPPFLAAGAKNVVVTTAGGAVTKVGGFTYTSSFLGGMPMAGDDSSAPSRGAGSEHAWAGQRGGNTAGAAGNGTDGADEAQLVDAPMGVHRYLQVIAIRTEGDVSCDAAPASADTAAVDAPAQEVVDPIDLDLNGEADLCQMRRGDLDLNGTVDQDDVTLLIELIGSEPIFGIGDLDGNGIVDDGDIAALALLFE